MRVFILSCFVVCLIAIAEGVEERSPTFENAKPSRDLKYRPQIVDQSQSVEKSIKLNEGAKPAFKTEIEQIDRKIRQLEDSLVNLKKQRQLLFYQNRLGGYSDDYYDHKDGKALADFLGVVMYV
uniref:Secreted protein n=2 Tax=Rhabditophanes sp. KR3021 TaxID=114890 RepID=A0AC35U1Y2_9BILA